MRICADQGASARKISKHPLEGRHDMPISLDRLLHATGAGVWESDLAAQRLWLSRPILTFLDSDLRTEVLSAEAGYNLVHPDDVAPALLAERDLIEGRAERLSIDLRLRGGSGAYKWVSFLGCVTERGRDGKVRKLGGIAFLPSDKTMSIADRLSGTSLALRDVQDGMAVTDRHGSFTYMNPSFRDMFGVPQSRDITRLRWSDLCEAESAANVRDVVLPAVHDQGSWHGELRGKRLDDSAAMFCQVSVCAGDEGRCIWTTRDIAEHMRLEADRQRLREGLIASQRNEIVHLLTAGSAHDLVNMLGLIQQMANLIESEPQEDPAKQAAVISQTVQQATALIRDRLILGKMAEPRASMDLRSVVENIARLMHDTLPEAVPFAVVLPEQPVELVAARNDVSQIVMNVLLNAMEAVDPTDGQISLEVDVVTGRQIRNLNVGVLEPEARYARLRVTDNGTGIPDTMIDRIFEPYISSKGEQGHGLGMFVIAELARAYNGGVSIVSRPGKGTVVSVLLCMDPPRDTPHDRASQARSTPG